MVTREECRNGVGGKKGLALAESFEASAAQVVEKIVDWHAGRSLKKVDDRLAALEAKVAQLNGDFDRQCATFEEGNALGF